MLTGPLGEQEGGVQIIHRANSQSNEKIVEFAYVICFLFACIMCTPLSLAKGGGKGNGDRATQSPACSGPVAPRAESPAGGRRVPRQSGPARRCGPARLRANRRALRTKRGRVRRRKRRRVWGGEGAPAGQKGRRKARVREGGSSRKEAS